MFVVLLDISLSHEDLLGEEYYQAHLLPSQL
jgi:hypothetical protein